MKKNLNSRMIKKKQEERIKNVYIVLTQTQTYPARLIHFYTHEPYAHASLAFDEDLEEMYSFARRGIRNPFNAGFIEEDIEDGIFGKFRSTTCNIYQLKVTEAQYVRLRREIDIFKENKQDYSYNYIGILGAALNIAISPKQKYFCSQFVAYVLEQSGINIFNKGYALVKPRDIRLNHNLKSIYHGKLCEYRVLRKKDLLPSS